MLDEIARTGQIERIVLAERGLVAIEHRVRQILHVEADAVTDDEHQDAVPSRASVARTGSRRSSNVSRRV